MQDSCQRFQDFSHWVVAHGILKKKGNFLKKSFPFSGSQIVAF